jgi:CubicO group peptidase (beta-lactamase class C family)
VTLHAHPRLARSRLQYAHDHLAGYVERGTVPGLVYLVSRGDDVYVDCMGSTSVDGGVPVTRDTIFRITSMTKPITAVATMILVEECKLRLDDPVDRLLPELANLRVLRTIESALDDTVPARRSMTVRDLLTFTHGSGIVMAMPDTYPIQSAMDELELGQTAPGLQSPPDPDEWLRRLGRLPLIYQPGERWMYGLGSDILGVLISRASGQSFEDFLRDRIFEPLGMRDTGFHVPLNDQHRFVTGYWSGENELTPYDEPATGFWSRPPAFPSGAGGLVSTVDDFHAFAQMLLSGGKYGDNRILSRSSVMMMTSDQLLESQKHAASMPGDFFSSRSWGFGVSMVTRQTTPGEPLGAYGWDGGFGTAWRTVPSDDLITILLTQAAWTSPEPPDIALDALTLAVSAMED